MKTVGDARQYICEIIGPRGLMPPDWTTVKRWMNRLDVIGLGVNEESLRSILELAYDQDFGAKLKLVSRVLIEKETGLSRYKIDQIAGDKLFKLGGRYCMKRTDYLRLFNGKDNSGSDQKEDGKNNRKKKGT